MMQGSLEGKRVVIALGGNALGSTPEEQLKLLEGTAKTLARMVKEGINVVVTHGNGPQVGVIDQAFVAASKDPANQVPFMPLADCNAMSQGYIGAQLTCALMNEFRRQDIMRSVADVPTYMAQGQFALGSMLPKVRACVKFVEAHPGGRALITSLERASEGLHGETGTIITGD